MNLEPIFSLFLFDFYGRWEKGCLTNANGLELYEPLYRAKHVKHFPLVRMGD